MRPIVLLLPLALLGCKPDISVTEQHTPPLATIQEPPDGTRVTEGEAIEFRGLVADGEDDPETLGVTWESDLDGVLDQGAADSTGAVRFATANLAPGNHVITLSVIDSDAMSDEDFITVTVLDLADDPTITVRHPRSDEAGVEGETFPFEVVVADASTESPDLLVSFASDLDGEFCTPTPDDVGIATCDAELSVGDHFLTFTVTDPDGHSADASVDFVVLSLEDVDDDGDGFSENQGDCADDDASVHPGALEVANGADDDCDAIIDEGTSAYDDDGDGYSEAQGDCNDAAVDVSPGVAETCDGRDNDCDTIVDDGTPCYDDDHDGFSENQGDCDDTVAVTYPSASEQPDGLDNDCDGIADEGTVRYDTDGDCFCAVGPCTASSNSACTSIGAGDCNDALAAVFPGAVEGVADGVDQDCDSLELCRADADGDGHGVVATVTSANLVCTDPGESALADDCDDAAIGTHPGATELAASGVDEDCNGTELCYVDGDGDGFGTSSTVVSADLVCTGSGEAAVATDCDDSAATAHPGAAEVTGDGIDEDCDGDELCFVDADADGYRLTSTVVSTNNLACDAADHEAPASAALDCDDARATVHPGATEVPGDQIDEDCADGELCYADGDQDGYRTGSTVASADTTCATADGEAVSGAPANDCNDGNAAVHPGATEGVGDSVDQDCDGAETCYADADQDGFRTSGTVASTDALCTTSQGEAGAAAGLDCNDGNAAIKPGATEGVGDAVDQDCDGTESCYADADQDGYRAATVVASADLACTTGAGEALATAPTDCDDTAATIHAGATEVVGDQIDQDCNGGEVCYVDFDRDGYRVTSTVSSADTLCSTINGEAVATASVDCNDSAAATHPGATEVVGDGVDEDCNGGEVCYVDADKDGYRLATTVVSTNATCDKTSGEAVSTAGVDCNDASLAIHPGASEVTGDNVDQDCDGHEVCYVDADKDAYRTTGTVLSSDTVCTKGNGEALSTAGTDCYDLNALAYPGAPDFQYSNRGDGSFDYNCSGGITYEWSSTVNYSCTGCNFSCGGCSSQAGWMNGRPNCGAFGDFGSGYSCVVSLCDPYDTVSRQQGCR
jgi:hypothetical protein